MVEKIVPTTIPPIAFPIDTFIPTKVIDAIYAPQWTGKTNSQRYFSAEWIAIFQAGDPTCRVLFIPRVVVDSQMHTIDEMLRPVPVMFRADPHSEPIDILPLVENRQVDR